MIALLDVNVLVALFDPTQVFHEAAHGWFRRERAFGWATCPLTETGLVRALSNPTYPGRRTTLEDAAKRLERFRHSGDHVFWPDAPSVCDGATFRLEQVGGHRGLTGAYLLAVAVAKGGRLATFDRAIVLASVAGASPANLATIH